MDQPIQTFSYTGCRRSFYSHVTGWSLLFLIEGMVAALLIVVLAPGIILQTILLAGLLGSILSVYLAILLGPLWTRHRLTATHLLLRYGSDKLDVPRANISSAVPVAGPIRRGFVPGMQVGPAPGRLTATFSDQGQILILLNEPWQHEDHGHDRAVNEILINVDDPDAFLAGLNGPQTRIAVTPLGQSGLAPLSAELVIASIGQFSPTNPAHDPGLRASKPLILAERLTCRYGDHLAVKDLNLTVPPGEIYGFLGPNGAGKSSAIKMLVGLLRPASGTAAIDGHDIATDAVAAKTAFGYVPDRAILYERLTGREFLHFVSQLRGIPLLEASSRIHDLFELLDLTDDADILCRTYSFGMKRKLAIAAALVHRPAVLILDEPMNGLDPRSARRLKDLLGRLADEGTAILLSTHDLGVAESLCHRIGILHQGQLIVEGTADEIRRTGAASDLEEVFLTLTRAEKSAP